MTAYLADHLIKRNAAAALAPAVAPGAPNHTHNRGNVVAASEKGGWPRLLCGAEKSVTG